MLLLFLHVTFESTAGLCNTSVAVAVAVGITNAVAVLLVHPSQKCG